MKKIICPLVFTCLVLTMASGCKKDNYDPPATWMTGRLVHNGQPMYMDGSTSDANDEIIQFFQDGYGKHEGWGIRVNYDGTFSSLLYDGVYKLMVKQTITYPWEWTGWPQHIDTQTGTAVLDTMVFEMNGNYDIPDIEITPYYEINDFKIDVGSVNMTASFTLKELFPDMEGLDVTAAYLYVGPTQLVNSGTPVRKEANAESINYEGEPITIEFPVLQYTGGYTNNFRDYAYARIAVRTSKSDRMLWSETIKVENLPTALNDISAEYLKNYSAPFTPADGCPPANSYSTPADWYVSDNCKVNVASDPETYPELQGCLELRFGRNCIGAISFDTNPQVGIDNGKMYQTFTLPAGRYLIMVTPFNEFLTNYWGGEGTCIMVLSEGKEIPDKDDLDSAIAYADTFSNTSMEFTIESETEVTFGFLFNYSTEAPLACGFTKVSLMDLGAGETVE